MNKYVPLIFLSLQLVASCKPGTTAEQYAITWSRKIKERILTDVSKTVDRTRVDTLNPHQVKITFYHQGIRTKQFILRNNDTLGSYFYSPGQDFTLVRELCPGIERNFEGIQYKGEAFGLTTFSFCNGRLKTQGLRYIVDVGKWQEWDSAGNSEREWDMGHTDRLKGLHDLAYR